VVAGDQAGERHPWLMQLRIMEYERGIIAMAAKDGERAWTAHRASVHDHCQARIIVLSAHARPRHALENAAALRQGDPIQQSRPDHKPA
jgi:hypothetical protein